MDKEYVEIPPYWCILSMKREDRCRDLSSVIIERELDLLVQYDRKNKIYILAINADRFVLPLIIDIATNRNPELWKD